MQKPSEIAVKIITSIKSIIEIFLDDIDKKKSFDELYPKVDTTTNLINLKSERNFNLSLFDEADNYYTNLMDYLNYYLRQFYKYESLDLLNEFKSSFTINNFSILTDLLLEILRDKNDAYLDDSIKFIISNFCEFFANKDKRLLYSDSYFLCCINELKKTYNKNIPTKSKFIEKMDEHYKFVAIQFFEELKNKIFFYFQIALSDVYRFYSCIDNKDLNEDQLDKLSIKIELIRKAYEDLEKNEKKKVSVEDLETLRDLMKRPEIYTLLEEYSNSQIINGKYNGTKEEYIIKYFFEPLNIIDIDMNDENNIKIIYNLKKIKLLNIHSADYATTYYSEYLNIKKEIDFASLIDYKLEIEDIFYRDEEFIKKFYIILQSEPVSCFLKSKIKFDNKNAFLVNFIDELDKSEKPDQYLKPQYEQFINDIKNDYNYFRKLIIVKNLCYKIPALSGPNMRIFINPIMDFSDEAKNDKLKTKSILESALIILLIHEIAHLLKFYPVKGIYPKTMPSTPKGRENGMCIIYHLFGINKITKINYQQSCKINDLSTWNNIDHLKDIFGSSEMTELEKSKIGELDLYISDIDDNIKKIEELKKNNDCFW